MSVSKKIFVSVCVASALSATPAAAQSAYSEEGFAQTMRKMEEARTCAQVYKPVLENYANNESALMSSVRNLCATGQKAEAISSYTSFIKQMRADARIKDALACAKLIQWANGLKPKPSPILDAEPNYAAVCN